MAFGSWIRLRCCGTSGWPALWIEGLTSIVGTYGTTARRRFNNPHIYIHAYMHITVPEYSGKGCTLAQVDRILRRIHASRALDIFFLPTVT